jgi:hypothetical protein
MLTQGKISPSATTLAIQRQGKDIIKRYPLLAEIVRFRLQCEKKTSKTLPTVFSISFFRHRE